ncbi:MAG: 3D domain-containing protein [Thermoleophilia bacterium]
MRRVSLIGIATLLTLATCAVLLSVALPQGAAAAGAVAAASQAHEEAVVRLLILERRVTDAETDLRLAEVDLKQSQAAATEWEELAEEAAADLTTARRHYADRLVETYKVGDLGWLELLFGSDDLSQLINRTVLVGRILTQDALLAREVERAQAHAEEAVRQAESTAQERTARVQRLRAMRDDLAAATRQQSELVDSLGDRLAAAEAAARAVTQRMAEMNKSVPGSDTATAGTTRTTAGTTARTTRATSGTTKAPAKIQDSPAHRGRQLTVKSYAYALRGTTATGVPVAPGVIAVDPRVIPLGTRLYVPGYGEGIAADTGGDIKGNTIDVWMSSAQAASDWGIKTLTITVYD